jgi:dystonin
VLSLCLVLISLFVQISKTAEEVNHAVEAGEELVDSGFAPDTQATREQVELLQRQLGRLDERARGREEALESALQRLEAFYQVHQAVVQDIADTWDQAKRFKPVATEVEAIRTQQEEYRDFHHAHIEGLTIQVDECNKAGQGLIQSAAAGVNTSSLEKDLEKMNEKWNDLKERVS